MNLYSFYLTLLFLISSDFAKKAEGKWNCSNCMVSYETIGCYQETHPVRQLPYELLNERDTHNKNFRGMRIDWNNWNEFMADFACRCAYETKQRGWTVFGLQYWGECWSGPNSDFYQTAAVSDECVGPDYNKCGAYDRHCIGKEYVNMVYKIVPECEMKFEPLGCYNDKHVSPRPLPELIIKERKDKHTQGVIDWRNWDVYLPQLVCRCAKKAKEMGYDVIGIQYYGECWSGPNGQNTYKIDGVSSNCVNGCYKQCEIANLFCAGKEKTNYVYKITTTRETKKDKIPDAIQEEKSDDFEKFLKDVLE